VLTDPLVRHSLLKALVDDWQVFLAIATPAEATADIRRAERTGRPLGSEDFLQKLETTLDRGLKKGRPRPKTIN